MTTYTMGYAEAFVRRLEERSIRFEGAFLLPHLRSGMSLLDVGCGPGSITVGLARTVAPGPVVGADASHGQLERARRNAAESGVGNVEFRTALASELPFSEGTFDAVFMNALLMHLADPRAALLEAFRVLRPGGVVGVRDMDVRASVDVSSEPRPENHLGDGPIEVFRKVVIANGGNPDIGGSLRALLHGAGFDRIDVGLSPDLAADQAAFAARADHLTALWNGTIGQRAIELGFLEDTSRQRFIEHVRARCDDPGSLRLVAWFHAVGHKPDGGSRSAISQSSP